MTMKAPPSAVVADTSRRPALSSRPKRSPRKNPGSAAAHRAQERPEQEGVHHHERGREPDPAGGDKEVLGEGHVDHAQEGPPRRRRRGHFGAAALEQPAEEKCPRR